MRVNICDWSLNPHRHRQLSLSSRAPRKEIFFFFIFLGRRGISECAESSNKKTNFYILLLLADVMFGWWHGKREEAEDKHAKIKCRRASFVIWARACVGAYALMFWQKARSLLQEGHPSSSTRNYSHQKPAKCEGRKSIIQFTVEGSHISHDSRDEIFKWNTMWLMRWTTNWGFNDDKHETLGFIE